MNEKHESQKDRNYIEIQFDNLNKTEKVEYAKKLLENVENIQVKIKGYCFRHFDIVTNNKAKDLNEHGAHEIFLEEIQKLDADLTKSKIKNLYPLKEVDLNSIPVLTEEMKSGIRGFLQDIDEHCFGLGMKNDPLYYDIKEIVFCHPKVKDDAVSVYNDLYDNNVKELVNERTEMLKKSINQKENKTKIQKH
jgi:hypothetical protein